MCIRDSVGGILALTLLINVWVTYRRDRKAARAETPRCPLYTSRCV
ncbi:hypothetical protein [Erwinia amylovora]